MAGLLSRVQWKVTILAVVENVLFAVAIMAPPGFDAGCETPDDENSENNMSGSVEDEREKGGRRKDTKDQDGKDRLRADLSE
jgi:hypothetical protein